MRAFQSWAGSYAVGSHKVLYRPGVKVETPSFQCTLPGGSSAPALVRSGPAWNGNGYCGSGVAMQTLDVPSKVVEGSRCVITLEENVLAGMLGAAGL